MSTATKDELPTIQQLFAAAKKAIGPVGKTGKNTQQNYNFRGVDAVVNAAAPHLDEHGVISIPVLQEIDYQTVETGKNRTLMAHVRVKVTYQFWGPAGDHLDATVPGEAMDSGDKATAKAMSVAYRIALLQALNLPTSDPDPDTQTYERSPRDESWRNQAPVNRPRGDGQVNGAPLEGADLWAEDAMARALALKDKDAASALYKEVVAKAKAGEISPEQKNDLCNLIVAQMEDLAKDAGKPAEGTITAPDGDPWQAEINSMSTKEDAGPLLAKLEQARGVTVDGRRYTALRSAIRTKANGLPSAPEAVPA